MKKSTTKNKVTQDKNTNAPARIVAIMMVITIVGKVLGLLRDRLQGTHFGADTAESIAFTLASLLPRSFLDIMFAAAFSASFIPIFAEYMETKNKRAALNFASLFITAATMLTITVVVVGNIFANPIFVIALRGDTVPYGTVELGTSLLRIMLPLMVLSGIAFSFTGILQALGEFRIPAAMSVVSNGIIIAYYFLFMDRFGVHGLAVAFLIGWGAQLLMQVPFLIKHKFSFRPRFNFTDPGLKKVGKLALPVLLSSWVVPINLLVNVAASSSLYGGEFGVVSITFANNLFAIITGVFVLSVSNVIFPKLSRQAAAKDTKSFSNTINETVRVLIFFLLPLTFGMMMLSQPLVHMIYAGDQFCETAVSITGTALFFFAPGIIGYGLLVTLSRACYAMLDGRTPIFAAVVAIITNIVLSFALAPHMDIAGPALANAVSQTIGAAILVVALLRKGILQLHKNVLTDILRMVICAILMLAAIYLLATVAKGWHAIMHVGVTAMVGAIVYFGAAAALRIKEMSWVAHFIKR